jgi:hypothetical protein
MMQVRAVGYARTALRCTAGVAAGALPVTMALQMGDVGPTPIGIRVYGGRSGLGQRGIDR